MNGGWYSFSGQLGKLRVPRVFQAKIAVAELTQLSMECDSYLRNFSPPGLLVHVFGKGAGNWYPLLAAKRFGKGRVTAWTTGASPQWGINFVKWPQYNQFWRQVFTANY